MKSNLIRLNFIRFQGKIEVQGNYETILNSGIDIANVLNKTKENFEKEEHINDVEIENILKNSSNSLKNIDIPIVIIGNDQKSLTTDKESPANEQKTLLKELEASSKGKVRGSLIVNYFKSTQRTYTLVVLIVAFLISQGLASFADIWVSVW